MANKRADLIFMKWKADLAGMDRTWKSVEGNFELLWEAFHSSKIKMDDALTYLDKAAKAHPPNDSTVKHAYKVGGKTYGYEGWRDYGDQWKNKITAKCREVFFAFYEIEGTSSSGSGKIGGMSKAEHARLQKYADSHQTIDWESLVAEQEEHEKKVKESDEDDINIDLSKVDVNIDLGDL